MHPMSRTLTLISNGISGKVAMDIVAIALVLLCKT